MSLREVLHRVGQAMRFQAEKAGWCLAPRSAPILMKSGQIWCRVMPNNFDTLQYKTAADRILSGRFDIFALRDANLGFPPRWNQDPKTLTMAPLVFGKTIDYRNEQLVGDIKYLWEPNRHLELVTLAQGYKLTGDTRYARGCQELLESWFDQCPYAQGVNWVSSLELAIRLVNWSFAWHLLGADQSVLFDGVNGIAFKNRWLRAVHQHCHFIAGHFSLFSSANNHLLGEYMGLLVAALTWPIWTESNTWQSVALQGFVNEALRQTGDDGVSREQAFYYHHEVMDMMLLVGLIGRSNGIKLKPAFWHRLESMMAFLAAIMDRSGHVPMVGDSDDALIVRFNQAPGWSPYKSLLATGAVLFDRADFAAKSGVFDDKSRWLLGDDAATQFAALKPTSMEVPRTKYNDAGYFLLGTRYGQSNEIRAMVDCGPLGYLSIAAHGHADALSLLLSAGGQELLVDPGTYAYHTHKQWRNYFKGTFAHNTVRIDKVDQSEIGGKFLWLHKANAHCDLAATEGDIQKFSGWHDGYHRLSDPLTHRREIEFNSSTDCFEVSDMLSCKGPHQIELCWHIADTCAVSVVDGGVAITTGNVCLTLTMPSAQLAFTIFKGQVEPPAGWISRSFDVKSPTNTLVWKGLIQNDTRLQTRLQLSFTNAPH